MTNFQALAELGYRPFFQQQISLDEWDSVDPARVIEQHRSQVKLQSASGEITLSLVPNIPQLVVGDWVLLNQE